MDPSLVLNMLALGTSFIALLASALLAHRQVKVATHGNTVPIIVEFFREGREPTFLEASQYILKRLEAEHSTDLGVKSLPEDALLHVLRVGGWYEDVGKLVVFGILDESIAIGSVGIGIERTWEVMRPYIYKERELSKSQFWIFFEDLAYRCSINPPRKVRAALGLRQFSDDASAPDQPSEPHRRRWWRQ